MPEVMHKLAVIMFTDIVGYTTLMDEDEDNAFEILARNKSIQKPLVEKYNGNWLKEIGDGVLISFDSTYNAVLCAKEILGEKQALLEPFRYSRWRNSLASGTLVILKFSGSQYSFFPVRRAIFPSSTVSVSGPEKSKLASAGFLPLQASIHSFLWPMDRGMVLAGRWYSFIFFSGMILSPLAPWDPQSIFPLSPM